MTIDSYICGENFIKFREEKGLSRQHLAQQLCCSKSQIQEIEEGGLISFYNESQKLMTAKKMAKFLAMNDQLAFAMTPPVIKSELDMHHFYGNENQPLPVTHRIWRPFVLGAVISSLCGFGTWGIYLANSHLLANQVIEQKDLNMANTTNAESEIILTSAELNSALGRDIGSLVVDPCQMTYQYTNSFLPARANFAGNFMVFVSKDEQDVCVIDSKGEKQIVKILPGQNKVVAGIAPFTIVGKNLMQIDTYYQGWKVANITNQTDSIVLKEAPVQLVSESTKPAVVNSTKEAMTPESNGAGPDKAGLSE